MAKHKHREKTGEYEYYIAVVHFITVALSDFTRLANGPATLQANVRRATRNAVHHAAERF